MATDVQIALQAQAAQDPEAALAAAAVRLARSTLQALAQQMGQSIAGKVLAAPNLPQGFTQIAAGSDVLTFRLSSPLPAGLPVTIDVAAGSDGRVPQVTIQPVQTQPTPSPISTSPSAVRVPPGLPEASARLDVPAAGSPQARSDGVPSRPTPVAPYTSEARPAYPAPTAASAASPVVAPTVEAATTAPVAQTNGQPAIIARPAEAPAQPAPTVTPPPSATGAAPASGPTTGPAVQVVATAPEGVLPTPTGAPKAAPAPVASTSVPQASAPVAPGPVAAPVVAAPTVTPMSSPAAAPAALPPSSLPSPAGSPTVASTLPPTNPPSGVPAATQTVAPQPAPAQAAVSAPPLAAPPVAPPQAMLQRLTQAFVTPTNVGTTTPLPPTPEMAATLAQAAAQQQSAAPLIDTLARQLPSLPPPVAEAAARVLAGRLSLDRGAPSGEALKSAVMRAGVLLAPPSRPGEPPDLKAALTQLKTALLGFLGGEVEPVAPVARRPPPPARGAPPRAFTPDAPQQPNGDSRETAKSLLGQTDGALARLKLLQLTSHGNDAARPGAAVAAPAEWNLELPLLLGRELAMAQIQISRDGKQKSEERERSWRLRFALKFSVLGEVGAQVAMVGKRTCVALWADETLTAETLEAMLPELAPALAAKGLELTSLTVRRGAPRDEARPMGQLMDSRR